MHQSQDAFMSYKAIINILIGGCLALLAGCATWGNSHPAEVEPIKPVGKSIVLLRMAATADYIGDTNELAQSFVARIGRIDEHGAVRTMCSRGDESPWHSVGGLAGRAGWGYLALEPGLYYLQFKPDFATTTIGKVDPSPARSYLFNVPEGKPLIYAGSFGYNITDVKEGYWKAKRFWGTMHLHYDELAIVQEADEARRVGRISWPNLGEVEPDYPLDYDNLSVAAGSLTNRQIAQVEAGQGVAMATNDVGDDITGKVAGPIAVPLMAFGFISLAASAEDADSRAEQGRIEDKKDVEADLAMDVVGLAAIVVAIPVVMAVDKTFGDAARKNWAPYGAALAKEFTAFNLPQQLVNETSNRLSSVHPANNDTNQATTSSGLVIRLQPYRVLMRETRHDKYALEIGVRAVLLDPASDVPLWQHDYVYSDAEIGRSKRSFLPAYETLINAESKPHALEDYENPAGSQLLHEQLTDAVTAIGRDVAGRFHDAGFSE